LQETYDLMVSFYLSFLTDPEFDNIKEVPKLKVIYDSFPEDTHVLLFLRSTSFHSVGVDLG